MRACLLPALPSSRRREYMWAALDNGACLLMTIGLGVWASFRQAARRHAKSSASMCRPRKESRDISSARLSPDGRSPRVCGDVGRQTQALDSTTRSRRSPRLCREQTGIDPDFFWAPDSRPYWVLRRGQAQDRASAEGGPPRVLTTLPSDAPYTGTWGANGDILLGVRDVNDGTELWSSARRIRPHLQVLLQRVGRWWPAGACE